MSKLIINSILVVDYRSEKANKFSFSDSANLLVSSTNGEGKSSLVKSIYYALGINLKSFPKNWEADNYIFQLEISIDNKKFLIKRHNKVMSALDGEDVRIFKNFNEYSKWFQAKVGLNLELFNKNNDESSLASVEALFSPMYIDQDKSWDGKLFKDSFEGLGRYKPNVFPKSVFDYYLGLSSNQIIEKENEKNEYLKELDLINGRISQVQSVYETYRIQKNVTKTIPKNFKELKKEIEFYIQKTDEFSEKVIKQTGELSNERTKLDILMQDFEELKKLSSKTTERFSEIKHECVYCHSVLTREQSLTRLELVDNELAINAQKDNILQKIKKSEKVVKEKEEEVEKLQKVFIEYHNQLTELKHLSDIDEYVNQNVLLELKKLEIQENNKRNKLDILLGVLKKEIGSLKRELNQRGKKIEGEYEVLKNEISIQIGSTGITDKKFRDFTKLKGSGTNLNKDLLTLFLVYMNLIDSKSSFGLPFAIDSFVKNETDTRVLEKMFKAIDTKFLTLSNQTFFSIIEENLKFISSSVNRINIKTPLLKSENYKNIIKEIIQMPDNIE
jgi:conserved hypothetical protein